jgi:hypothetical protein
MKATGRVSRLQTCVAIGQQWIVRRLLLSTADARVGSVWRAVSEGALDTTELLARLRQLLNYTSDAGSAASTVPVTLRFFFPVEYRPTWLVCAVSRGRCLLCCAVCYLLFGGV